MAAPQRIALDSGAVIALARGKRTARALLHEASSGGAQFFIPAPVLTEILRGGPQDAAVNHVVKVYEVLPTGERAARLAGAMLRDHPPTLAMDALISATALHHGADAIWTQDAEDHESLAQGLLKIISVA